MSAGLGKTKDGRPQTCVEYLGLWDKIQVRFLKDETIKVFSVRVEDFSNRILYVSFPDARQKLLYGERVEATFTREQGLYKFDGILDTGVHDGRQYLTIRVLSDARHIQRRTAVRLPLRLQMAIAAIDRPICSPVELESLTWDESMSDNFSASGALIRTTASCVIGDLIVLRINREQLPVAPEYMLASWRRLQRMGERSYMGIEFITRRLLNSFLLPEEIPLLPNEVKKFTERTVNLFGKFVFDTELKMRQEGKL